MKLRMLYDLVLINRKKSEEMTASGKLFIPSTGQSTSMEAEVLAVGPGRSLENGQVMPLAVKPGDVVLVPADAGIEVKVDGESYSIVPEDRILGIIE